MFRVLLDVLGHMVKFLDVILGCQRSAVEMLLIFLRYSCRYFHV